MLAPNDGPDVKAARELLADARNYLLDLDGCVWFGSQLAPGAAELIAELRRSARRALFVTNNSGATSEQIAQKLNQLGIPAEAKDAVTPLDVLQHHPALQANKQAGKLVMVLGPPRIGQVLTAAGFSLTDDPAAAGTLVVGNTRQFTYMQLVAGMRALDQGAAFLALNLDRRVPVEGGEVVPGCGALVAFLQTASLEQRAAEPIGKPAGLFFDAACQRFGITAADSVMVGDTPDTDVLGGRRASMRTVQVGPLVPRAEEETADIRLISLVELLPLVERHDR